MKCFTKSSFFVLFASFSTARQFEKAEANSLTHCKICISSKSLAFGLCPKVRLRHWFLIHGNAHSKSRSQSLLQPVGTSSQRVFDLRRRCCNDSRSHIVAGGGAAPCCG